MRGLAWDDQPEELARLREELRFWRVELEIESDIQVFAGRLERERWDFVVTDLMDGDATPPPGIRNARRASLVVGLVFILTQHDHISLRQLDLPNNVVLKSKETPSGWLASEIVDAMKDRGLYCDYRQVFVIYGRDRHADGASGRVAAHLEAQGLQVVRGDPVTLQSSIADDLVRLMRPCAAFIAICTPDDTLEDGTCVPRGNVLFEMGICLGLSGGLRRLTILQRWGPKADQQARLPSDFGGNVTTRFESGIDHSFATLDERLRNLGVGR